MEEITISAIIMAAPMLVMGLCWIKSKYALYTLLVLILAAVGIPVFKDIFALTELVSLVGYLGITEQLALCVVSLIFAWTVFPPQKHCFFHSNMEHTHKTGSLRKRNR